jgi:hypothetical protein
LEQCAGLVQVGRLKAFGKPAVDRGQQRAGGGAFALLLPQPRQARGSPQLQSFGVLTASDL